MMVDRIMKGIRKRVKMSREISVFTLLILLSTIDYGITNMKV